MNNLFNQPPEPVLCLQLIIYMMPVMVILYIVMMWANHEDYKKQHNIKGWSDKPMTIKQLIYGTVLSCIVGTSGYLIGAYYGSISMLDSIYGKGNSRLNEWASEVLRYAMSNIDISSYFIKIE